MLSYSWKGDEMFISVVMGLVCEEHFVMSLVDVGSSSS